MEDLAEAQPGQDIIFPAVHLAILRFGSIVPAAQVQQAVEGVEQGLLRDRSTSSSGLPARFGDTNVDLAGNPATASVLIDGECQNISWAGDAEETLVQI